MNKPLLYIFAALVSLVVVLPIVTKLVPGPKPAPAFTKQQVPAPADPSLIAKNQALMKQIEADAYRQEIARNILSLDDIAGRFHDLNQVGAASARVALPAIVQQMQALRREAAAIPTHACLIPAKDAMASIIGEAVDGYLSFMSTGNDATTGPTAGHFERVRAMVPEFVKKRDACVY